MRTREFWMKDLYSFCATPEQHETFYEKCAEAYMKIFDRLGIGDQTYRHLHLAVRLLSFRMSFKTLAEAGEDVVYVNEEKGIAVNEEVLEEADLAELISHGKN